MKDEPTRERTIANCFVCGRPLMADRAPLEMKTERIEDGFRVTLSYLMPLCKDGCRRGVIGDR